MKFATFLKISILLTLLLAVFTDVTEAAKKTKSNSPAVVDDNCVKTLNWNIMVYIMGNNDLSCESFDSVAQMAAVQSDSNNYQFTLLWARSNRDYECGNYVYQGIPSWKNTVRAFQVKKTTLVEFHNFGNINSADPSTISQFIPISAKYLPSDDYIFLFWGHGGGTAFGVDATHSPTTLLSKDLAGALANGLAAAKIPIFEVLGFDASLMGSQEDMSLFGSVAKYYLASPELAPGEWDWSSFGILKTKSVGSVSGNDQEISRAREQLGQAIVNGYFNLNPNATTLTLSFSQISLAPDLTATIRVLALALTATLSDKTSLNYLWNVRYSTFEYGNSVDPDSTTGTVDLVYFCSLLAKHPSKDVQTAAKNVISAVNNVVKYDKAQGEAASSHGISIFFPGVAYLFNIYAPYYKESYTFNSEWYNFLLRYFSVVQDNISFSPSKITRKTGAEPTYHIETPMSAASNNEIIYASMSVGLQLEPSKFPNVLHIMCTLRETLTTTTLISDWDGQFYLMRGDTDPPKRYIFAHTTESNSDGAILEIPLVFTEPDNKALTIISFADARNAGQFALQLRDYFVFDFHSPYNTGTYSLVTGSVMTPLFPAMNLTSMTPFADWVSVTGNTMNIKNTTKLKLYLTHWARPSKNSPLQTFNKMWMFQEATDASDVTTIQTFTASLSDPGLLTADPVQRSYVPPKYSPNPSLSKRAGASKSRSKKASSKSRSHSKKARSKSRSKQ